MKYNPDVHHRRSIRVKDYAYSRAGAYFLTMCLQSKRCLFGNVANGEMMLNDAGKSVQHIWNDSIGRIVQAFKSITTHEYTIGVKTCGWIPFHGKLWQRNYYEHIVRTEDTLNKIREYIQYNPLRWHLDRENPEQVGTDALEDEIFKHDTKDDADS